MNTRQLKANAAAVLKFMKPGTVIVRCWQYTAIGVLCLIAASCSTGKWPVKKTYRSLKAAERVTADTLLLHALDHEALYTMCDTLKPISSVKMYRLPLLSDNPQQHDSALAALDNIQRLVNKLNANGDYCFVLNPFERADSIFKNIELYAVRKSRLQSIIRQHRQFYSRLGITEHTPPATVLAITEHENKYDRWRSYGYLFGYPDYAVDFFVHAGKEQDSTLQFVPRSFFHIPVHAGGSGYFTYAIPKGYQPGLQDTAILLQAGRTLQRYRNLRNRCTTGSKTQTMKLLRRLQP